MYLSKYLFFLFLILTLACRKEHSQEGTPLHEGSWNFIESGQHYSGPVDSIMLSGGTIQELKLFGRSASESTEQIFIKINAQNITAGLYASDEVLFQYIVNGLVIWQSNGDIVVEITEIDDDKVSGIFSGVAFDSTGTEHVITEGNFQGTLSRQALTGVVSVWTKQLCSSTDEMTVKIGGSSKVISITHSSAPGCSDNSTANFTLPYGNYELEVTCGTDVHKTQISVNVECTLVEISINGNEPLDYLPLGLTSAWEYNDAGDPFTTQTLTVAGEATIAGKTYSRVDDSRGNAYYFRKNPPDYYEYKTLGFQDFFEDPPSMELVILKDNLAKGQQWETEPMDLKVGDIVKKSKLVFTIVDRDYSEIINGVEYKDLINVRMELFFSPDGIGYATSGSSFNTVFSKGNGIVKYNDMDINIEWNIKNLSVIQ